MPKRSLRKKRIHIKTELRFHHTTGFLRRHHALTFANAGAVHHPDERRAELAVCGDAVLRGLEDVAVVLLHLQRAAEVRFIQSLAVFVCRSSVSAL